MENKKFFNRKLELEKKFMKLLLNCHCGNNNFKEVALIRNKPKLEIDYKIKKYIRKIFQCSNCGHCVNCHNYNLDKIYLGDYVKNNYGNLEGIKKNFLRITKIKKKFSDNKNRVLRILYYLVPLLENRNLLDIGSGLGVFPYEMKKNGFKVTCIEKDKFLLLNIKENIHVDAYNDFTSIKNKKYDLVTLNKVLEHIKKPLVFLRIVKKFLNKNGFMYLEVPDYLASKEGFVNREEFYIEHYNIFSEISLLNLTKKLGLKLYFFNRIKEPSGKYTIFGIFKKN
jgi:SAM-dependent methyltransferase